jgi:hypothetical protein
MKPSTHAVGIKLALALPAVIALASCAKVQTENKIDVRPIEVKPIHITVDVNVRVDKELDNFFAFEDQPTTKPATQPVSAPVTAPAPIPATTQTGA